MTTLDADLPVDEHRITVEAPPDVVWPGLRQYVDSFPARTAGSTAALVIGTRLHVVAMRRLLGSVRRACVAQV